MQVIFIYVFSYKLFYVICYFTFLLFCYFSPNYPSFHVSLGGVGPNMNKWFIYNKIKWNKNNLEVTDNLFIVLVVRRWIVTINKILRGSILFFMYRYNNCFVIFYLFFHFILVPTYTGKWSQSFLTIIHMFYFIGNKPFVHWFIKDYAFKSSQTYGNTGQLWFCFLSL